MTEVYSHFFQPFATKNIFKPDYSDDPLLYLVQCKELLRLISVRFIPFQFIIKRFIYYSHPRDRTMQ